MVPTKGKRAEEKPTMYLDTVTIGLESKSSRGYIKN